jgi:2-(1,2-epoxy-1,2-dihydrophenyl)acetyl-CoA isomerase
MEHVDYELADGRATVTLDNPESRNALSIGMAEEITEAVADATESGARCVVVEGSEGSFCAGGDIDSMLGAVSGGAEDLAALVEEFGRPVMETVQDVYECPVPTVAKVDGPAYGAGGTLAVACDIVLASERTQLSFGFRQIGMSIDSGTSYLLPRLVGESTAKHLTLTGRVLDAEEAADLGLVQELYPTEQFDEGAEETIQTVADGPTVALEHTKSLLQSGLDRSMGEAIDHELEALTEVFQSADFAEGVGAFAEGRSPEFDGE